MGLESCDATALFRPGWSLALYEGAREASGVFRYSRARNSAYVAAGNATDPERAQREASQRARRTVRRYATTNRLNRLGTLTYGEPRCTDPVEVRQHVALFFRALRTALGGDPFPYIWVPELHRDGEHFHLHFAVARFIHVSQIKAAWGRGHVHIKLLGDLPVGSDTLEEARTAARYLSKYVTKAIADTPKRASGMHRYDLAQGFHPIPRRFYGDPSSSALLARAASLLGGEPVRQWSSAGAADWSGPPAVWAQWAG